MPRRIKPAGRHARQGGYILIALLLGLAVLAAIIAMGVRFADRQHLITVSKIEGESLAQFAVGLRGFVATAQSDASLIPTGTQAGVDWLKPPTCGGRPTNPPAGFVPCGYTGQTFGSLYRTTFTYTAATKAIEARTSFIVPTLGGDKGNSILIADRVVGTALSDQAIPNNGMFYTAMANVAQTATAPVPSTSAAYYAPGANAGRVLMVVNNAPSNDLWLRTDGTNQMLANLNMGGQSIASAKDARFAGRIQVDSGMTVTKGTADFREGVVTTDVSLVNIGKAATQGIYDARVLTGAAVYTVNKPDCSKVGNRPAIYVSLQGSGTPNFNGAYSADTLYESRADVVDLGSRWRITPVLRGTKFDLAANDTDILLDRKLVEVNPTDMRLVAMVRCQ